VIWLLEHRINSEFRGKPKDQVVTLLWFSFSTLYFTHGEKLLNHLSRIVIIIWLFVVLILKSSYTASLTSMLTVSKLEPTFQDVASLSASGVAVGYQEGSFIGDLLQDPAFGIAKENLRPYSTLEEAGEALAKGPKNGVAAIFDEIPYLRIFLASQCGYTTVGPIHRTGGFGFVFPKGSPLASDVSRAVLSFSEDKEIREIEDKWFSNTVCTDSGGNPNSDPLGIQIFWGLYAITGGASLIALIICIFRLLYSFKRDPNVKRPGEMGDQSAGKSLKSLTTEMKSFLNYVDQKEGSRTSNSPCSTPCFTSSPSAHGTSPFRTSALPTGSFSFRNHAHVPDADENTNARPSTASAPEITEEIPPSRTQPVSATESNVDVPQNALQ